MRQGGLDRRQGARVAEGAESLDAGDADPPVRVVGRQAPFEDGEEGRYGLGGAQVGEQPDRQQCVGDAEFVGGEGGGRPCGARVAKTCQGVGGGDAALRLAVVEEQDQGFEGARIAGEAEPEGGDLAGPEGLAGCGQHAGELLGIVGGDEFFEWLSIDFRAVVDLVPQSIDHRAEFGVLGDIHGRQRIRDPDHTFRTPGDWRARYSPVNLR